MTRFARLVAPVLVAAALCSSGRAAAESGSAGNWDPATIERFRTLPIQDGGRVKPLDTYASFLLLQLNGKRTFTQDTETGESVRLDPMEWFLDCLFYPEAARDYRHFVVDNADLVTGIGAVAPSDKQRIRFSYSDLLPARQQLFERAQGAFQLEQKDRTPAQNMYLALEGAVQQFEGVTHYLDFTRTPFDTSQSRLAQRIFGESPEGLTVSSALAHGRDLRLAIAALQQVRQEPEGTDKIEEELGAFSDFLRPLDTASRLGTALALIVPADPAEKVWLSAGALVDKTFQVEQHDDRELLQLAALEGMAAAVGSPLQFKARANEFHDIVVGQAKARGEYRRIPLEVQFYKARFFSYAQIFFVLGFLIAAVSWLNLRSRVLAWGTSLAVAVPWALLVTGIVYRCIIRGRPPISTLYETILFITAVSVLVALFIEFVNRQRIAVSVAAFLGSLGIFLANRYEITNREDTMPQLVAVLDTNFWLATHVTIINVGYAAGMLAAGIAHVYVLGRLIGLRKGDKSFYRGLTRMVYGVTCFGLIFAFIGTVLGGIWANYSWGRFWGWDPKENGAALICLAMLATLHARMGGYIREMGLSMCAVATGCVVAFSWWGVNLLGVGLHSYGFTSGIWTATYIFWGTQALVVAAGLFVLLRDRLRGAPDTTTPRAEPKTKTKSTSEPVAAK
jgi:ABC-type transport system involved in cytochrome c biogenesis permease subunit